MKIHVMDICRKGLKHSVQTLVEFLRLVLKEPLLHSMSVVKISFRLYGLYSIRLEGVGCGTVHSQTKGKEGGTTYPLKSISTYASISGYKLHNNKWCILKKALSLLVCHNLNKQ